MKNLLRTLISLLVLSVAAQSQPQRMDTRSDCAEGAGRRRILPTEIGRPGMEHRQLLAMPCDTMIVPKGSTTLVHPNVMLHFRNPSLKNFIKVEGDLVFKGNKDAYVYLSSSLDTLDRFKRAYEPGTGMWSGLEVAPGGSVEMEFAVVVGAPTPLTAFSQRVMIKNTLFKGASGIVMPNGEVYPMEPKIHAVRNLDLAAPNQPEFPEEPSRAQIDAPSSGEKEKLFKEPGSFWTAGKIWSGVAVVTVVSAGASLVLWNSIGGSPSGEGPDSGANPLPDPNTVFEFPSQER